MRHRELLTIIPTKRFHENDPGVGPHQAEQDRKNKAHGVGNNKTVRNGRRMVKVGHHVWGRRRRRRVSWHRRHVLFRPRLRRGYVGFRLYLLSDLPIWSILAL